jgi:hypothetical protein
MTSCIISFLVPLVVSTLIFAFLLNRTCVIFEVTLEKGEMKSSREDNNSVRLAETFIGPLSVLYLFHVGFLLLKSIAILAEGDVSTVDYEAELFSSLRNLLTFCSVGVFIVFMMMRSKKVFTVMFFSFEDFFREFNNKRH